jgi:hypothetical protein
MFQGMDLFPSSGENAPTLFGPFEGTNLNHWIQLSMCLLSSPEDGNRSSVRNLVF